MRSPSHVRLLPATVAAALGLCALGLLASNAPSEAAAVDLAADSDLEKAMGAIDEDFDLLRGALQKKDAAASLELTAKIQTQILAAKVLAPSKAKSVEEAARPAFVAGFRKQLVGLLKAFCDLETAVIDGDFAQAETRAGEIERLRKAGHDEYKKKGRKKE
jgi:hypothetical protein